MKIKRQYLQAALDGGRAFVWNLLEITTKGVAAGGQRAETLQDLHRLALETDAQIQAVLNALKDGLTSLEIED